jgi:hypothetical protein
MHHREVSRAGSCYGFFAFIGGALGDLNNYFASSGRQLKRRRKCLAHLRFVRSPKETHRRAKLTEFPTRLGQAARRNVHAKCVCGLEQRSLFSTHSSPSRTCQLLKNVSRGQLLALQAMRAIDLVTVVTVVAAAICRAFNPPAR